ncbi:hypothetical protein HALA3H3_490042 [Halomonas sp. A3H3]|nr:hypothetical protein HALA3H3_490042 [Halomonas sp. A3H3]
MAQAEQPHCSYERLIVNPEEIRNEHSEARSRSLVGSSIAGTAGNARHC